MVPMEFRAVNQVVIDSQGGPTGQTETSRRRYPKRIPSELHAIPLINFLLKFGIFEVCGKEWAGAAGGKEKNHKM